jgi:Yip1-like protein
MATLVERAIGAARLDPATYEEVESDTDALGQAMTVVVVAAIASGIGSAVASGGHGFGLVRGAIGALVGWFVWAFTVYVVGTRLLPQAETKADLGELLRTTGFASAPGVIGILGIVPVVGGLAMLVAWLWQLAAMVVAVRQALDYTSTGHAIAVCVIGFVAQLLVMFLLISVVFGSAFMLGSALTH